MLIFLQNHFNIINQVNVYEKMEMDSRILTFHCYLNECSLGLHNSRE